jgi:phage terminase small subunit
MEKGLKAKQEKFCLEYIKCGNAKEAAIRAGYSQKSATPIASEILTYPKVQERLKELRKSMTDAAIATAEEVLIELTRIAMVDMKDFVTVKESGEVIVKDFDTLPAGATRCIKKISQRTVRKKDILDPAGGELLESNLSFELWSKTDALEALGRHHDLFTPGENDPEDKQPINITFSLATKK